MRMPESMVVVATFAKEAEAQVARTRLEAEGIPCVLIDLSVPHFPGVRGAGSGGWEIRVDPSYFQAAIRALNVSPG